MLNYGLFGLVECVAVVLAGNCRLARRLMFSLAGLFSPAQGVVGGCLTVSLFLRRMRCLFELITWYTTRSYENLPVFPLFAKLVRASCGFFGLPL